MGLRGMTWMVYFALNIVLAKDAKLRKVGLTL